MDCVGRVGKPVYAGLLLLLFIAAFGLPSLAKYRDHKTILVRRPASQQVTLRHSAVHTTFYTIFSKNLAGAGGALSVSRQPSAVTNML